MMKNNLSDFVIRQLKDKIKTRYVIESDELFNLFHYMGIVDDYDALYNILEHMEVSNIDVNFGTNNEHYRKFKSIESAYKFAKTTKIRRESIVNIMNKVDNYNVPLNNEWMSIYRTDEDDSKPEPHVVPVFETNPDLERLQTRIKNEIESKAEEEFNQMSDEERLEHAMNLITETQNFINNNQ